jgi:uncharacterized protein YmfQ (DUF2313 family)
MGYDIMSTKNTVLLLNLLPPGRAWLRSMATNIGKLLYCFGAELARAEQRQKDILTESIASTASETLIEWETCFNLVHTGTTLERQGRIVAALRQVGSGGQSISFFYSIAKGLGYNVSPSTTDPHLRIADNLYYGFRADYGQADIDSVYDEDSGSSDYTWEVLGTNVSTDTTLQAIFNKLKPAHTEIVFIDE